MSKKLMKCECGGKYCEGSTRHYKTKQHIEYLEQIEKDNDLYLEIIALLCIEKFSGKERMAKSKKYVDDRMSNVKDRRTGLRSIHREIKGLRDSQVED